MDSFEFNKIAGAVLGTALAVFGLQEVSGAIYHSGQPEVGKQGFAIEAEEAAATEGAVEEVKAVPLAELLKTADVAKGKKVAGKCAACHSFEKGGAAKVGPALWDVVERQVASAAFTGYSEAMKAKGTEIGTWSYEHLNSFLIKPSAYVPKTKMAFAGLKDADRANMLAYLQSLSDAPKPFPAQ